VVKPLYGFFYFFGINAAVKEQDKKGLYPIHYAYKNGAPKDVLALLTDASREVFYPRGVSSVLEASRHCLWQDALNLMASNRKCEEIQI
jgi:hypothetical protein